MTDQLERHPRGTLFFTRRDHLMRGSTPPISDEFGDDTIKGDTMSDAELTERYSRDLIGIKSMMEMPEDKRMEMFGDFIEGFPSDLAYYNSRGIDIAEGLILIGGEANLPDINELRKAL